MRREYENDIIQMCHEEAIALHKLGAISDERMKEFDEMAFVPEPKNSESVTSGIGASADVREHARVYASRR